MNIGWEMHDSLIKKIEVTAGLLRLWFAPGIIHKSLGIPGVDDGEVFLQTVVVTISNFLEFDFDSLEGKELTSGKIEFDKKVLANIVPLPFVHKNPFNLILEISGENFNVSGNEILIEIHGEPKFLERFRK